MNRKNIEILKPILVMLSFCGLSFKHRKPKVQTILYIIFNICITVNNIDLVMINFVIIY